jgi:hypothetical protein
MITSKRTDKSAPEHFPAKIPVSRHIPQFENPPIFPKILQTPKTDIVMTLPSDKRSGVVTEQLSNSWLLSVYAFSTNHRFIRPPCDETKDHRSRQKKTC